MLDTRNRQAIFTSLKNAITTDREAARSVVYDNHRVNRVVKETPLEVESFGFRGAEGERVTVTVHPGSQVDNRDLTTDSVHFSYGGREYESSEYYSDSGIGYDLWMFHKGDWRPAQQVYAPDDKLK